MNTHTHTGRANQYHSDLSTKGYKENHKITSTQRLIVSQKNEGKAFQSYTKGGFPISEPPTKLNAKNILSFLQRCLLLALQCVQSQEYLKSQRTQLQMQKGLKNQTVDELSQKQPCPAPRGISSLLQSYLVKLWSQDNPDHTIQRLWCALLHIPASFLPTHSPLSGAE